MHQPNWRPHKRGSSGQDWTPADWDEFAEAEQLFYWKKKNRGLKRKQWWADKKAGLNPKQEKEKRQRETQEEPHEGQHPTESNDPDAAAPAAPPQAAEVALPAAPVSVRPKPPVVPPPWHVEAKARPRPSSMILGPHRPTIVNPRPLGPAGNSPGFLTQFQHTQNIFVPQEMFAQLLRNLPRGNRFDYMNNLFGVQGPPHTTHLVDRPPVYYVEDDESDEEVIDRRFFPIGGPPDEPPGTGGSSFSKDRP